MLLFCCWLTTDSSLAGREAGAAEGVEAAPVAAAAVAVEHEVAEAEVAGPRRQPVVRRR